MVTKTLQPCTLSRLREKRQYHNLGVIYLLTVMKPDSLNLPTFAKFVCSAFVVCGCLVLSDY